MHKYSEISFLANSKRNHAKFNNNVIHTKTTQKNPREIRNMNTISKQAYYIQGQIQYHTTEGQFQYPIYNVWGYCRYTTWPNVCEHLLVAHLSPKISCSPFTAITASTLLGRLSIKCWNIAPGNCFHSATRALVRSGSRSNSSQRCSMGLRSVLCAGQSSSSTPISTNHFCIHLALCIWGHCHAGTGKDFPQTVAMKLEAHNHLECHCMLYR